MVVGDLLTDDINNPDRNYKYQCLKDLLDVSTSQVDQTQTSLVRISPNPSDGDVRVEYEFDFGKETKILVMDLLGRDVLSQTVPGRMGKWTIKRNDLPQGGGIYLVSLLCGDQKATKKLKLL